MMDEWLKNMKRHIDAAINLQKISNESIDKVMKEKIYEEHMKVELLLDQRDEHIKCIYQILIEMPFIYRE